MRFTADSTLGTARRDGDTCVRDIKQKQFKEGVGKHDEVVVV